METNLICTYDSRRMEQVQKEHESQEYSTNAGRYELHSRGSRVEAVEDQFSRTHISSRRPTMEITSHSRKEASLRHMIVSLRSQLLDAYIVVPVRQYTSDPPGNRANLPSASYAAFFSGILFMLLCVCYIVMNCPELEVPDTAGSWVAPGENK